MAAGRALAVKPEEAATRRRERMRAVLVEAALRLFAKQGVDAPTIDEIVNVAGVVLDPVKTAMLARLYDSGAALDSHGNEHLLGDVRDGIAKGRFRVADEMAALHLVVGLGTIAMRHLLDNGAGVEILRGEGYARNIAAVLLSGLGLRPDEI